MLSSARHPRERAAAEHIWLRTCYHDRDGNGTDATHEALLKDSWMGQNPPESPHETQIYDDAMLYDYGPGGWQCIFTRIPELL